MGVRHWIMICLLALAGMSATATALADSGPTATVTAQPNQARAGSKLVLSASGSSGGLGQSSLRGITLALFKGFKLDLAAVAERCNDPQGSCPPASRVATGEFQGRFSYLATSQSFSGTIDGFLAPATGGDLADVIVRISAAGQSGSGRGHIVAVAGATFGYELRFDPLPQGMVPPGASVTIDRLSVTTGASRTVATNGKGRRSGGRGKRGRRAKKCRRHHRCPRSRQRKPHKRGSVRQAPGQVTHSLLTNPGGCAGSWPLQLRVRYSDHTDVRDLAIACSN